jgi:hypothetical protein
MSTTSSTGVSTTTVQFLLESAQHARFLLELAHHELELADSELFW